jgi:phosphoserine phosphatase RsbU/P
MKPLQGRVLVVDDDPAMLRTVERILVPRHEVRGFASGDQALAAVRQDPFDVAIVDIRMPGMDGFELTHVIKEIRPRTEVILVTGSISDLDEKLLRSIEERAFYFITKPFSRAVLTSLVGRCLEMQRLEEERDDLIRRLTEDLDRARRYQQALLPQGLPRTFGSVRVAAAWVSSEAVGGDLFDVASLPESHVLVMMADVAGHGVAAALLTGMVKTAIGRSLLDPRGLAPAAQAVIDTMAPLRQSRVVTLFLGLVDEKGGTLHYLNAGHPPALIWSAGREPRQLGATTPLLSYGISLDPDPVASVPFRPGDRLGIYSDGLYEVLDPAGSDFGRDALIRALTDHRGSIEEVVESVMDRTRRHAGGRPPDDDLTLLVAEALRG